ncbi:DedA family protein [Cohnella zeiphila]|uniref:DedA family protein n=1 Tax=Cohnella zeiphila TaxID=2761120 RepID=A0A7X0STL7_9BACL|nr:DedA family protein [Cohnella zeiphila]MBB6735868.1 DedA family protein [Cohnella zeiphila]
MSMADGLLNLVFQYRYGGLFASMSLGLFGLPVPDELLLTASGYLLASGRMLLGWTLLAAVGGSVVGMSASYWIGRTAGTSLVRKFGSKLGLTERRLERHERLFAKWGQVIVLIGFFIPGLRHVTSLLAGIGKRSYRSFASYATIGSFLWASVFLLIGSLLGEHWREVTGIVHRDLAWMLALAAVPLLAVLAWRFRPLKT